jgi:hypothetical protein
MSFREWTRIAQNIHSLISAFRSSPESSVTECTGHHNPIRVQPLATLSRSFIDTRFIEELELRRYSPYLSRIKNQIR